MSMHFTRMVFLDGILVPTKAVTCSWNDMGQMQAQITLVPSYQAEKLFPSTHVHIFHVETGLRSVGRSAQPISSEDSQDFRFLHRDESVATIGERFSPALDFERGASPKGAVLSKSVPFHAIHYRFGGEVVQVAPAEGAGAGAEVVLACRGYEHLLEIIQTIQLTRGSGTLSEQERRFFGQQNPVFTGRGRRAFYGGLADLLADRNYLGGIRAIIAVYAAATNQMWANRFPWARMAGQVVALDDDTTVDRLFETSTFKRFLRESFQQAYSLPLRQAIDIMLTVPRYKLISVPTPTFFPLVRPDAPAFREVTELADVTRRGGLYADVSWESIEGVLPPDEANDPGHPASNGEFFRVASDVNGTSYTWRYVDEDGLTQVLNPSGLRLPGGELRGNIEQNDTTLTFTIPPNMHGGGASYVITLRQSQMPNTRTPFAPENFAQHAGQFVEGNGYVLSTPNLGEGRDAFPIRTMTFFVQVRRSQSRTVRRMVTETVQVDPAPRTELYENDVTRLSTYAIVPELWWAVPPACNIVIPETLRNFSYSDPGINNITRLLGKIAPGRSGSSRVMLDKFAAPNVDDLNASVQDLEDDLHDSVNLMRNEYISGVRVEVHYFELLHRLVREEDWEPYLRSFIVSQFWSKRLGAKQGMATVRTDIHMVVGAPCLIIRGTAPPESSVDVSPEQQCLLRRLGILERILRRLQRCRSRLRGRSGRAERLQSHLQSLINLRRLAEDANVTEELNTQDFYQLSSNIRRNHIQDYNSPEGQSRFDAVSGGSREAVQSRFVGENNRNFRPNAQGIDDELISSLISDPEALVLNAPDGRLTDSSGNRSYPSERDMLRWFNEIPSNVGNTNSCAQALSADIEVVTAAIEQARDLLRDYGLPPAVNRSMIGYVKSLTESVQSGGESMQISLTHMRHVGDDLDWDQLAGDDVENTVTFGPNGFMDERYSVGRIGEELYLPIFGCKSIADLPLVQNALQAQLESDEETLSEQVGGLPPGDASDVLAQLSQGCCSQEETEDEGRGTDSRLNTTFAARAVAAAYFELKQAGVDNEGIMEWFNDIRTRATMTLADAYRDSPVVWGDSENQPALLHDLTRDDSEVYGDGQATRGFFADSFIGPEFDFNRVVVRYQQNGEEQELPLTENEKDMLRSRTQAVLDYVLSTIDTSFSRSG